jgi:hypothetical protein
VSASIDGRGTICGRLFFEHRPYTVGKLFPEQREAILQTITAIAAALTPVNFAVRRCGYPGPGVKRNQSEGIGVLTFYLAVLAL